MNRRSARRPRRSSWPSPRRFAAAEGHGTDLFAGYSFAKIDDVNRHGGNPALGFDLSARSTASWTRAPTGAAPRARASTTSR